MPVWKQQGQVNKGEREQQAPVRVPSPCAQDSERVGLTAREHHVCRVRFACVKYHYHERDGGHDPADEVGRPLCYQQRADHSEGTKPYDKRYVLYRVFERQSSAALKQVAGADTRYVQGDDQPAHHARKEEQSAAHPTHSLTLFPCPFCHNTTLQHHRLQNVTARVSYEVGSELPRIHLLR